MKKSELKAIIKEEIQNILKEEAPEPKFKKGDSFAYRGVRYTVVSDNGYVVKVVDKKGNEATYNYNQLKQGMSSPKPDFLKEEDKKEIDYEVYYSYRERGNDPEETETPINVKASSKEEAIKLAKEKLEKDKPSRWRARINNSFEAFEKKD